MGARAYLVEQLAGLLDDFTLVPWDDMPTISGKTVVFYRSEVTPTPEAPLGSWTHAITLYVATPKQMGEPALDALDEALDEVLLALHQVPGVLWTRATYKTLNDTWPAFEVTATVITNVTPEE